MKFEFAVIVQNLFPAVSIDWIQTTLLPSENFRFTLATVSNSATKNSSEAQSNETNEKVN